MEYNPRFSHAFFPLIASLGLLYWYFSGNYNDALWIGALGFALFSCIVVAMQAYAVYWQKIIQYLEAFVKLDAAAREALGFHLPALRLVVKRGRLQRLFEDTHATDEHIRLFLQDSNSQYTASERTWNTADRPRWAHQEIITWLVNQRRVIPESYAGNRSWRWVGTSYRALMAYWPEVVEVQDLNEQETEETRVYASED